MEKKDNVEDNYDDSILIKEEGTKRDLPYSGRMPPEEDLENDDLESIVIHEESESNDRKRIHDIMEPTIGMKLNLFFNRQNKNILYLSIILNIILIFLLGGLVLGGSPSFNQNSLKYEEKTVAENIFFDRLSYAEGTSAKITINRQNSTPKVNDIPVEIINIRTLEKIKLLLKEEEPESAVYVGYFTFANETNPMLHNLKSASNDTIIAVYYECSTENDTPSLLVNKTIMR